MSSSKGNAAGGSGDPALKKKKSFVERIGLKKSPRDAIKEEAFWQEFEAPSHRSQELEALNSRWNATPPVPPPPPFEKGKKPKKAKPSGSNAAQPAASTAPSEEHPVSILKAYTDRDTQAEIPLAAQLLTIRRTLIIIMAATDVVKDANIATSLLKVSSVVSNEQKTAFRTTIKLMTEFLRTLVTWNRDLTKAYDNAARALNKKLCSDINNVLEVDPSPADYAEFLKVMLHYAASD